MIKKIAIVITLISTIILIPFLSSYLTENNYVQVKQEIASPVFDSYDEKYLLVYFGYVGCIDICTPRLTEISSAYNKLKAANIDVGVVFINLSKIDDPESADLFAKSFNKNFKGIYPEKKQLESVKKEFKVYSALRLGDSYEMDHTSFLYLLKKNESKYNLNIIYTTIPLDQAVHITEFTN